jgi:hypothetical protein
MRADMFKVIVERPRWGASHAPAVKLKKDKNVDRKFVGHRRHAWEEAAYTKSLNENLAPLKRFLQKQRGRLWNDVFSEICQRLDTGSTVKMHVREHIEDLIMVRISVDHKGNWLGQHGWRGASSPSRCWPDLYVDPFDGVVKETRLLCQQLGVKWNYPYPRNIYQYEPGPFDDFRRISACKLLLRRNGLWFHCTLNRDPKCSDGQLRDELKNETWLEHGRWSVATWKQLSKRELKLHKLNNRGDVQ